MDTTHDYSVIEQVLNHVSECYPQQPKLSVIASYCQLSEYNLQRVFTDFAGVSLDVFVQQLNRQVLKARLMSGESLLATHTNNTAYLNSNCPLMVTLKTISADELISTGADLQFWVGVHDCVFGRCLIINSTQGIYQLAFIDNDNRIKQALNDLKQQWPLAQIVQDNQATEPLLALLFNHPPVNPQQNQQQVSLWLQGSTFQIKVWEALLKIPMGQVSSYSDIAQAIGQPRAARAVGSAIGKNPVAAIIPCHRVIQQLGNTGAYRWGATRKQAMLGREACHQLAD